MDHQNDPQNSAATEIYNFAANLMVNQNRSAAEVRKALEDKGLGAESASVIVSNLENQIKEAKKQAATKDMLFGALWCVGGIVATVADFGYIFWGAIVFGGIQFFKGLANAS